jgi:hypothetical protein
MQQQRLYNWPIKCKIFASGNEEIELFFQIKKFHVLHISGDLEDIVGKFESNQSVFSEYFLSWCVFAL